MAICDCGSPPHCCQPAVAGGVIYAHLRGELSTHLAPQALFTQSFPVSELLLEAFPFQSTLGEVTLHPLSQAGIFIHSSHGKWAFPPLLWSFPPTTTFTSFPTPDCWACAAAPAFSSPACLFTAYMGCGSSLLSYGVFLPLPLLQAFPLLVAGCMPLLLSSLTWFVYLQFCEEFLSLTLRRSERPTVFATCLLLLLLWHIIQFLCFSLGGSRSVQGAMLIWPRVVCGSTLYRLAHLVVCIFPSHLGTAVWRRHESPPGFSV
jgi:hypothetical protein